MAWRKQLLPRLVEERPWFVTDAFHALARVCFVTTDHGAAQRIQQVIQQNPLQCALLYGLGRVHTRHAPCVQYPSPTDCFSKTFLFEQLFLMIYFNENVRTKIFFCFIAAACACAIEVPCSYAHCQANTVQYSTRVLCSNSSLTTCPP